MAGGERREAHLTGSSQAPYGGPVGRTRTEPVQVWMPDGGVRSMSVYVAVDAQADPALAALARGGNLHHLADGIELAIPFVYHDSALRLLVLVVPEGLRHRALALRAEHMAQVAIDAGHAVPDYVRDAELVFGARGLTARINGQPSAKLHSVPLDVSHDAQALATRERELRRRERLVRAREQALREAAEREAHPRSAASMPQGVEDSEVEEIEDVLDVRYERALVEAEIEPSNEVSLAPIDEPDDSELSEEQVEPDAESLDDLDELDDIEDIEASEAQEDELDDALTPALVVPQPFVDDPGAELWMTENDGRVWLFVRRRPSPPRDASELELLLQLDPDAETPIALVTLVFDVSGAPELRHGAVDPGDPAQVRALALLAEHFEVELVSVDSLHEFEPWATLNAPREANARAVLSRLTRREELDPERYAQARELLLRAPPPWREAAHPFQAQRDVPAAQTVTEAAVQLDELGAWLAPARRERLRLLWCVPDELIHEHTVQCLTAALDWGLSLSESLSARAIELGVSPDARALLERRIRGLCRASQAPDEAGLEESVLRALWLEALEQAAKLGVTLPQEARALAQRHAGERAIMHAAALSDHQSAALDPMRARALAEPVDLAALEELLTRGGHSDLLLGCRALLRVSAEQAGRLFARVALRDDPAAVDALLSLLAEDEQVRVRVGAALALAQRRAVYAIDQLVANLAREQETASMSELPRAVDERASARERSREDWRLFALALGRYGGGSFRAIARALVAHKVNAERTALVFALLCCHGARSQLRAKARSGDVAEAQLAETALSLATGCRSDELSLMALEEGGDLAVFCGIFDRSCAAAHV